MAKELRYFSCCNDEQAIVDFINASEIPQNDIVSINSVRAAGGDILFVVWYYYEVIG